MLVVPIVGADGLRASRWSPRIEGYTCSSKFCSWSLSTAPGWARTHQPSEQEGAHRSNPSCGSVPVWPTVEAVCQDPPSVVLLVSARSIPGRWGPRSRKVPVFTLFLVPFCGQERQPKWPKNGVFGAPRTPPEDPFRGRPRTGLWGGLHTDQKSRDFDGFGIQNFTKGIPCQKSNFLQTQIFQTLRKSSPWGLRYSKTFSGVAGVCFRRDYVTSWSIISYDVLYDIIYITFIQYVYNTFDNCLYDIR